MTIMVLHVNDNNNKACDNLPFRGWGGGPQTLSLWKVMIRSWGAVTWTADHWFFFLFWFSMGAAGSCHSFRFFSFNCFCLSFESISGVYWTSFSNQTKKTMFEEGWIEHIRTVKGLKIKVFGNRLRFWQELVVFFPFKVVVYMNDSEKFQ